MALSVVQAVSNEAAASATTIAVTITTTAGNLLVIVCREGTNNTDNPTVSDSASQTWTQADSYQNISPATSMSGAMFYMANSAAVTSVTVTFSTGGGVVNRAATVYEISGASAVSPLDAVTGSSNSTAGTSFTSGSLTTTNANDIILFGLGNGSGGATSAGLIGGVQSAIQSGGQSTNGRTAMEFLIVSTTQSAITGAISWTSSTTGHIGWIAAFKAAPALQSDDWANPQQTAAETNVSLWR